MPSWERRERVRHVGPRESDNHDGVYTSGRVDHGDSIRTYRPRHIDSLDAAVDGTRADRDTFDQGIRLAGAFWYEQRHASDRGRVVD